MELNEKGQHIGPFRQNSTLEYFTATHLSIHYIFTYAAEVSASLQDCYQLQMSPSDHETLREHYDPVRRVATKWFFRDFAKYKFGRNKIYISQNFAKWFCRNFAKFRKTLLIFREVWSCYLFRERNFAKFHQILILQDDFYWNFGKFCKTLFVFRKIIIFAEEILLNFVKYLFR